MESVQYIVGGIYYLLSPTFREKKRQQWKSQGSMVKIHEIGMWLTTGLVVVLLIATIVAL
jgi:hypothetical protein